MNYKHDLCLFMSPGSLMLTLPELGIPQLKAYLRARGLRVNALDLNTLFLADFLKQAPARALLERRFTLRRRPEHAGLDVNLKGTHWGPECQHGKSADIEAYTALLGLKSASFGIEDVLQASGLPDELYDSFFEQYVAPAAAGVPLAGFSILSHDQLPPALYLARKLKTRFPGIKVCLGGPWCTATRPVMTKWPALFGVVDAVVFYGGEVPLEGLVNHYRGRGKLAEVPNLAYLDKGRVRLTPLGKEPDLDSLPMPDFDFLPLPLYTRRVLPYQTASGCTWGRCVFCYHCFPANHCAMKSPLAVARHLESLKLRHGVTQFWFANLTVPFKQLDELSRLLISRHSGILWSTMTRAEDGYTPEFARQLYDSGCTNLFIGLETSDRKGLKSIRKGLTTGTFERTLRACSAAGISVSAFLLSYPGQTRKQFEASVAYAKSLRDCITDIVISRFELGRASNAMRHLTGLGIKLPPGNDRDIRSFSLPYSAKQDIGELSPDLKESLKQRDSGRAGEGKEILIIRPPSLRICAPGGSSRSGSDAQVMHGSLPFLHSLARQLEAIHSIETRVVDCAAPGKSKPEPGPCLHCGNYAAEGQSRATSWGGLTRDEMRAALSGARPAQVVIYSGPVHDYLGVHRVLDLCR